MKIIRGLHNLPITWSKCVVTIGNFDGLHLGHQQLITRCLSLAAQTKLPSVLMTFEPYPQAYFTRMSLPRLMGLRDKYLQLSQWQIDYLLIIPFTADLASLSAENFVQSIVVKQLKAATVVVGDDFRFGAHRHGDYELLKAMGYQHKFAVEQLPTYLFDGKRVSSSWLRMALRCGDLSLAKSLLGRDYHLSGRIVYGEQRGHRWGYPTINVFTGQPSLPLSGIFVVEVDGLGHEIRPGVASVGCRPMYPADRDMLEVYLLDFNRTVYQQYCTVNFLERLRNERCFTSEAELVAQIDKDVAQAQEYFQGPLRAKLMRR